MTVKKDMLFSDSYQLKKNQSGARLISLDSCGSLESKKQSAEYEQTNNDGKPDIIQDLEELIGRHTKSIQSEQELTDKQSLVGYLEEATLSKFKRIGQEFKAVAEKLKNIEMTIGKKFKRVEINCKNNNLGIEELKNELQKKYTPLADFKSYQIATENKRTLDRKEIDKMIEYNEIEIDRAQERITQLKTSLNENMKKHETRVSCAEVSIRNFLKNIE